MGETPIADAVKRSITEAFRSVPADKRGALLVIADEHGARAVAARLGDSWKVAAGTAVAWEDRRPVGYVAIEGSW